MSNTSYSRIIYSPDVKVYILPGVENAEPIDISQDIIEGSVTRTTEGVSTASFLVQSRKVKDNVTTLLGARIRPMDRIVVYLKKVKPILVFSGYLDLVPIFQAVPEPFVIEASCTLKRLEFTYWDPQLPHVYEVLSSFGFIPSANGEGGMNFFTAPDARATGSGSQPANGPVNDTGFAAMLYFLLHNVGGWKDESIWIEPLPNEWMQRAYYLFQVSNDWNERYNTAQSFLKTFLTSGGTSGGGGNGGGDGGGAGSVTMSNESTIKAAIANHIKKNSIGSQKMTADDFITPGKKYNIDPRFLAALALAETHYGTAPNSSADVNNCYGYKNSSGATSGSGTYYEFPSFTACVDYVADVMRNKNYYIGDHNNQTLTEFLTPWNKSSAEEKTNISTAWKQMETANDKVDLSKPYSATGQGIATSLASGDTPTRDTVNPSPSDRGPNTQLSVYIEAGHSGKSEGEMQPGYQNQTGGDDGAEVTENRDVLTELETQYNALPDDKKSKLNITFSKYSSRPRGYISDVYISIHHDADFTKGDGYVGGPCQFSVRGLDENIGAHNANIPGQGDQQGKPGPNYYQPDGGTGWKMPSELGEGRDRIDYDKSLIKNSSALIQRLINDCSFTTGRSFKSTTNSNSQSYNRMNNYYGFYYSNAAACCIMELPALPYAIKYSKKNIAKGILAALLQYQKDWKGVGKQEEPFSGTKSGPQTNDSSSGDDSPASKVIAAALKATEHNQQNWDLPYHMDGNDRANGKTIEEVIQGKLSTDCSSFINCCMKSAGIAKNASETTYTLSGNSTEIADKTKYEPGMLFNSGGHVVLVVSKDGKIAESNHMGGGEAGTRCTGADNGPQTSRTADSFVNQDKYKLYKHNDIGSTLSPPSGGGSSDSGSGSGSTVDPFLIAKSTAFNIAFNFPGSMMDSVLLTGERALENDVKLLDTIQEVCKASQRTFSSLPNGDFIAWYPDYFNLSGKNAWLKVSPTEIKSCTISLNDNNLVTHLYILGNPFGFGANAGSQINLDWYEKLMGSGVVTIERPWVLDSFLRPFEDVESQDSSNQVNKQTKTSRFVTTKKTTTAFRPRPVLETQNGGKLAFLERYGARPYFDKIPTIRHPILEFFYAYHTFIQKWAEQYISKAEFTFMPELFPGMILEFDMRNRDDEQDENDNSLGSITFYVKDVTHHFSYENGFSTTATLMAPGTTDKGNAWAMVLVKPPDGMVEYKYKKTTTITSTKRTKKTKTTVRPRRANPGGSTPSVPPRTQNSLEFPSIDQTDGGNN